jgi:competence protein ComEC
VGGDDQDYPRSAGGAGGSGGGLRYFLLRFRKKSLPAVLGPGGIFFLLGWMRTGQEKTLPPNHVAHFFHKGPVMVEGTLDRPPKRYSTATHIYLNVEKIILPSPNEGFPQKKKILSGLIRLDTRVELPPLGYGDRIRVNTRLFRPHSNRNPGGFDYRDYLGKKDIYRRGKIRSEADITLLGSPASILRRVFDFRNRAADFIGDDTPQKKFLLAVLLGMRETLPYRLKESFTLSGAAHLLAISGLHIGILASFFFIFFRETWRILPFRFYLRLSRRVRPKKLSAIACIPLLVGYTILVGARTPTVRALIMIVVYLVAVILEREREHFNVLALAATGILFWRPASLYEVDFQLSFTAVFFIIYAVSTRPKVWSFLEEEPGWKERLSRKMKVFFLVSLAAYVSLLPLIAYHFKRLSLVGLPINLLAVPLFSLIMPFGFLGILLFPISQTLAEFFISICLQLSNLLIGIVKAPGEIERASILVYQPTIIMIIIIYAFFFCLWRAWRHKSARWGAVAFLGLFMISIPGRDGRLEVSFLDVGHGDATFIQTPKGKTILIDSGGSSGTFFDTGKNIITPFLSHSWVGKLNRVILSHPHADHYGGLPYIIKHFPVGEFWNISGYYQSKLYKKLERVIRKEKVYVRRVAAGDRFDLGGEIKLEILHPPKEFNSSYGINDKSIVLRLVYRNVSFLFPGDLLKKGEEKLLASTADISATVLKIPHHGAGKSSGMGFLRAVNPDFAVLFRSFNKNSYSDRKILKRYRKSGIRLLDIRREGCVTFYSDGETLWLETFKGTRAVHTVTAAERTDM